MTDVYNYPCDQVQYAQINARGEKIIYDIESGSADWPSESVNVLKRYSITPKRRLMWKALLFMQYFLPHRFQHRVSPLLEDTAAVVHHKLIDPLAHKWPEKIKLYINPRSLDKDDKIGYIDEK
jgi:hypothetical protein